FRSDVLHPQEEDHIPESPVHEKDRRYLHDLLEKRFAGQAKVVTLSDCLVHWGLQGLRSHSPDITVLFNVRHRPRSGGTFYIAKHGGRPVCAIEITSPETRVHDVGIKVEHYHRAGVQLYIVVDREREEGPARLLGYRYTPQRYVKMRPDKHGRLLLKPLGLLMGVKDNRVVCYDAVTVEEIGDYTQVSQALEAESRARQVAEHRLRELEAELRRLREERK
ncbi:MAG: Uma2 family endonuclease, partial [Gemmataceae bacterium]|nr:Uma2 family endonuclease [Gemmataceae bacterium]